MFNDSLLRGTRLLIRSQNVCAELLWKYMIYRHDFSNTIQKFSRLIGNFVNLTRYASSVYKSNVTHQTLVDNVFKKLKQSLLTDPTE